MLKLSSSFLSSFFCIIFVSCAFSLLSNPDISALPKQNKRKADELQRRKEIAEGYISSLDHVKESWTDPFQMIGCQSKDCMDILKNEENILNTNTQINTDVQEPSSDDAPSIKIDKINHVVVGQQIVTNEPFVKHNVQTSPTSLYFSRWVKKLLLLIEKETIDESSLIYFSLNKGVLSHLKELSNGDKLEIYQVDELFTNLLDNANVSRKKNYDWMDVLDYTKYIVWGIAAGSVTIYILYLFYISSLNHPYFTSFFIFLCSAVFWHWMHLFQQRVAFKQAELSSLNIPHECKKHDFGFFEHIQEYLKSFFKSNDCVKYHEALSVDPFWEVSITVAISEAFAAFILQPLSTGSHILNKSLKHLFDELSVEIKIFLIVFILLMLVMKCNYRIKLPIFMGVIEPCLPVGSSVQNVQPTECLTESSNDRVETEFKYIQEKDKKRVIKQDEYDKVHHSGNKQIEHVRHSSERVQILAGPNECHTCGCYSKSTNLRPTQETKSVSEMMDEQESSTFKNFQSEIDDICLDQPVKTSIESVNAETNLCSHDATTISKSINDGIL